MSESIADTNVSNPPAEGANTDTGGGGKTTEETPKTVPYERLSKMASQKQEAIDRADAAEAKLAERDADDEKVRQEKLKQEGKTEELLTEANALIEELSAKAEKSDAADKTRRESLLSELPEDQQAIYGKLDTESLAQHVKLVRGADGNNGGKAFDGNAANGNQDVPPPKDRSNMTRQELATSHAERLEAYKKKYKGRDLNEMRGR